MKNFCLSILMLVGMMFALPMFGPSECSNEARADVVEISGNGVRLRTGPGTNYSVYCQLDKGKQVAYNYTTSDGNWYCVTYNGNRLYVSRDFASLRKSTTSKNTTRKYTEVVVRAKNLRVRTGPSTNYPYLVWNSGGTVHLNHGDVLPFLGETQNGFYKVRFDGKVCWIACEYGTLR